MLSRQTLKRTFTQASLVLATMSLLTGCIVIASPLNADVHQQKELTLSASSFKKLDIEAGSGELIVKGSDQATEITVIADIYTSSKSSNEYELELSDSGSTAFLIAKTNSSGIWMGDTPHIDLVVTVPTHMILDIDDGSGAIDISNIDGEISINDGSGALKVQDVDGQVSIVDGSGAIELNRIIGNVAIEDGSGSIDLNGINGDLSIEDGSGSIYAQGVSGNADINDGSGDLTVKDVTGTITLEDGSGDIEIEDAGGLKIIDSGSGGLKVHNVKGGFEIES